MSLIYPIFIPLKKESQRVPGKNFRDWGGKPLWLHTVEKYDIFQIFIDTDSEEIIEECKPFNNVTAYKRREDLCGHKVSVCDLIVNCVKEYDLRGPMAQIHVTNPFLQEYNVFNAIQHICEYHRNGHSFGRGTSCFSCNEHKSRFWRKDAHGLMPVNHNPMNLIQTQNLPTYYEENSCVYAFFAEDILKSGCRISSNPYPMEVKFPENLDIDTEADWDFCKAVRRLNEEDKSLFSNL